MEVYLIPVGPKRYELYCEDVRDKDVAIAGPPSGVVAGLVHRFKAALVRVERERRGEIPGGSPVRGWAGRLKERALGWIAEKIAEQRLLWHLRDESEVTVFFPDDLSSAAATAVIRGMLQHDADRHVRWLVVDAVLLCVSGVAAFLPGPNILAYYFAFRLVGHYLSMRGARQGLVAVTWHHRPSALLARLRQAMALSAIDRGRHVREVESQLHLQHLASFFERTAVPTA